MDILTELFKKYSIEDNDLIEQIRSCSELCTFKPDQTVFSSSNDVDYLYFIVSGVVRLYTISPDGNELTDEFIWKPGDIVLVYKDFITSGKNKTINETCEACAQCTLLKIPFQIIRDVYDSQQNIRDSVIQVLFQRWKNMLHLRHVMMCTSAQKRYRWFLRCYPGLIDLVPHKHIASFLGMNPVTLSRIRKSCAETAN